MELDINKLDNETLIAAGIVAIIFLMIKALYANTFRLTLKLIAPENRFMKPGEAWLVLIPIFNIYWNFELAKRMADSLTNEFYDRKIAEEEAPGRSTGLTVAVLYLITIFPLPLNILLGINLVYFFYFIVYWVKINRFRELLKEHNLFMQERNKEGTTNL
ncbi:hypothetical protein H8S90_06270 [Olivibacter sp. SDN3]|uniref:hypothetical protein n=1 Tax=Olivibacter sp. SDN3 TaxID=2764720 RepID=UPI0016518C27|nr:hypothetical protein [Olivibacter sp. SDN3]QNL51186.1 hypothetical protein H8S90_06270 [Olivibacter sp. SDN3]